MGTVTTSGPATRQRAIACPESDGTPTAETDLHRGAPAALKWRLQRRRAAPRDVHVSRDLPRGTSGT